MNKSGNEALIVFVIVLIVLGGYIVIKNVLNKNNMHAPATQTGSQSLITQTPGTPEDLIFTGIVNGHMTQGKKGDSYVCLPATTGPIVGKIGAIDYTFEFRALDAKGPGTYNAFVQIGPLPNTNNLYYGSDKTKLIINADKRSGTVEGNLENLTDSNQKVHLSGSWTCPPDY